MTDSDDQNGGTRQKPHGLVRPYVPNARDGAGPSRSQRDAAESLMRDDRPALDGTGDRRSQRIPDARFASTRHDAPRPTAAQPPARNIGRSRRAVKRRARRRRLTIIGAGAAALAIVGGAIVFLSRPSSELLAGSCRTAGCRQGTGRPFGIQPPAGQPASSRKGRHEAGGRPHPTPTHPARPSPTLTHPTPKPSKSSPAPTSTPSSSPTASPAEQVKVSYVVVSQHPHSFQGQFTIVNSGSTAIKGWELVVVLPGDRIHSVWDGLFHTDGDTLTIEPSTSQRTIAPGARLTENVSAHGSTATPTGCTFNGSSC